MKKAKTFEFIFPITNLHLGKATHVGDVTVNAIVYQFPDGSLHRDPDEDNITVDIDSLVWNGSNIRNLIECVAEDTYNEIVEAARQHGAERFEIVIPQPEPAY